MKELVALTHVSLQQLKKQPVGRVREVLQDDWSTLRCGVPATLWGCSTSVCRGDRAASSLSSLIVACLNKALLVPNPLTPTRWRARCCLVELLLYTVALAFALTGLLVNTRLKIRNFSWIAFVSFFLFVVLPSYPVYHIAYLSGQYRTGDFSGYFASILLFEALLFLGLILSRRAHYATIRQERSVGRQAFLAPLILVAAVAYLYLAITAYGGSLPIVDIAVRGANPVTFRIEFWRDVLPRIPMASLIRFLAKTGTVYLGLRFLACGAVRLGWIVIALSLLVVSIEGTKSSLLQWGVPLLFFGMMTKRFKVGAAVMLGMLLVFGTVGLSLLEADHDIHLAIWEKTLARAFVVPVEVSMTHYELFRDQYLLGGTNPMVMQLQGGPERVLPAPALDYDNYVMRYTYYQRTGQEKTYGSMNAPSFIYGWVDFGLFGVVVIGVLTVLSMLALDILLRERCLSQAFLAISPMMIVVMITSRNFWDSILGPEGIGFLLALDSLGRATRLSTTGVIARGGLIAASLGYYLVSFLVVRLV